MSKLVTSLVAYFGFPNIEIAEDLVHDTFLSAIKSWENTPPNNPKAWLFKACKNKAINYLNKSNNRSTHR